MQLSLPITNENNAAAIRIAFRSGMSRSKDFWGAAQASAAVGVVAGELSLALYMLGIPRYLGDGGNLFIDSGAFSELKDGIAPDFNRVLDIYEMIADAADVYDYSLSQLYVVSPDKVGDQLATLERMAQYKDRIKALIAAGVRMIVPIQRGSMPATEMLARVAAILETDRFVAGIPSCKEALSIEECRQLKHHAYHILGRVQMNPEQHARLQALGDENPNVEITADANWLRSRIGVISEINDAERRERMKGGFAENLRRGHARTVAVQKAIERDATWSKV